MKIQYANEYIKDMGLDDPTTYFYQFNIDENYSNSTKFIQYFIMHRMGLCSKLNSFVERMHYLWSFSNNTEVPIGIKKNKYFLS